MPTFWSPTKPGIQTPGGVSWWAVAFAYMANQLHQATTTVAGTYTNLGTVAAIQQKLAVALVGLLQAAMKLQQPTTALAGAQAQAGTAAPAMVKLLTALSGVQAQQGTLADVLPAPQTTLFGGQGDVGNLATALQKTVSAITGVMMPQGTIAAALQLAVTALAGAQTQSGTIATAELQHTTALTGIVSTLTEAGIVAAPLPAVMATDVEAAQTQSGTTVVSLPAGPSTSVAALQTQSGSLAYLLPPMTTSVAALQTQTGTIGGGLPSHFAAALAGTQVTNPIWVSKGTAVHNGNSTSGTSGTGTWTETIDASAKVTVAYLHYGIGSTATVCTLKIGTTSMVAWGAPLIYTTTGATWGIQAFVLKLPPTGAQTFTYQMNWATSHGWFVTGESASYNGCLDVADPQTNTGSGTAMSQSVASTDPSQTISQAFGWNSLSTATGYTQTERYNLGGVSGTNIGIDMGDAQGSASAVSFAATAGLTAPWGSVAVPLLSSVAPTPSFDALGQAHNYNASPVSTLRSQTVSGTITINAAATMAMLYMHIGLNNAGNAMANVTVALTINGVSQTVTLVPSTNVQYDNNSGSSNAYFFTAAYKIASPPTGTSLPFVATIGWATTPGGVVIDAYLVSYLNAAASSVTGVSAAGSSTTPAVTVASPSSGHALIGGIFADTGTSASNNLSFTGPTQRAVQNWASAAAYPVWVGDQVSLPQGIKFSTTMAATQLWGGSLVSIKAA